MKSPNSAPAETLEIAVAMQRAIAVLQQRAARLSAESLTLLLRAASFEEFLRCIWQEFPCLRSAPQAELEAAYQTMLASLKAQLAITALPHHAIGAA